MHAVLIKIGISAALVVGTIVGVTGSEEPPRSPSTTVPATHRSMIVQDLPPSIMSQPKATVKSCDEVLQIALDEGWPASELATVKRVVFRESRCINSVTNRDDPGVHGSIGLFQLNSAAWCLPSKYWPEGYLQAHGVIEDCYDLYNATINIRAALVVWQYGEDRYGYGWGPWRWLQPSGDSD